MSSPGASISHRAARIITAGGAVTHIQLVVIISFECLWSKSCWKRKMLHLSKDIAVWLYFCLRLCEELSGGLIQWFIHVLFCLTGTDKTPALLVVSLFVGVCVRLSEFFHHSGYRKKNVSCCSASPFMVENFFSSYKNPRRNGWVLTPGDWCPYVFWLSQCLMPRAEPDRHGSKLSAANFAFHQAEVELLPSGRSWHWEIIARQFNCSSWEALITFIGTIYSTSFDLNFYSLKLFLETFLLPLRKNSKN